MLLEFKLFIYMKGCFFTVLVAIVISCVGVNANAQNLGCYLSLNGGATIVDNQNSPMFGVRFGVETELLIGEGEISYLSMSGKNEFGHKVEEKNLATMTAGFNLGIKFIQSHRGYLAAMLYNGYSLQEDWYKGHGGCYDYYCDYGYYDYGCGYGCGYDCYDYDCRYHEGYYIGFGLSGAIDVSYNMSIFGEARYQSIPVKGRGDDKWGAVVSGGVKFYF